MKSSSLIGLSVQFWITFQYIYLKFFSFCCVYCLDIEIKYYWVGTWTILGLGGFTLILGFYQAHKNGPLM